MRPIASAQMEISQIFPQSGWVEHDPLELLSTTLETARAALAKAGISAANVAGIGITNQRETTVVWDKSTGQPVHNAVVWQDRRTSKTCEALRNQGYQDLVTRETGLLLDPYFSATKLAWILEHIENGRARALAGELLFGTVDSWLIWNMTNGAAHVTDATNAARTMLFDIHTGTWSAAICEVLNIPEKMLPAVLDCSADFGVCDAEFLGGPIGIYGVAGDQQAATIDKRVFSLEC